MIKRLVFGGAVIESIPANVGLAILRVFCRVEYGIGTWIGEDSTFRAVCGRYRKFGVSLARVFCLDGSLFGVWRRATAGTGITHATWGVFL